MKAATLIMNQLRYRTMPDCKEAVLNRGSLTRELRAYTRFDMFKRVYLHDQLWHARNISYLGGELRRH